MRVVNMAHGAFYLLGGYIAYEVQQRMTADTPGFIPGTLVTTWEWLIPMAVAMLCIGGLGFVIQQAFLRWNQGQDLRQALITIALSVIIADQVIAHFPRSGAFQTGGGNLATITWPGWTERRIDLQVAGVEYSLTRLAILALGIVVGVVLWAWLHRTRTGMVIRAGVDDRQMTSALGINIQRTFALAFFVGSALAALGGAVGASQGGVAPGAGRVVAALFARRGDRRRDGLAPGCRRRLAPRRARADFSASYLPSTGDPAGRMLHAVLDHLHLRTHRARARLQAAGTLREGCMSRRAWTPRTIVERTLGLVVLAIAVLGPAVFSSYFTTTILTQTFILGIAAASLIFLSAYGGMISLAQTR